MLLNKYANKFASCKTVQACHLDCWCALHLRSSRTNDLSFADCIQSCWWLEWVCAKCFTISSHSNWQGNTHGNVAFEEDKVGSKHKSHDKSSHSKSLTWIISAHCSASMLIRELHRRGKKHCVRCHFFFFKKKNTKTWRSRTTRRRRKFCQLQKKRNPNVDKILTKATITTRNSELFILASNRKKPVILQQYKRCVWVAFQMEMPKINCSYKVSQDNCSMCFSLKTVHVMCTMRYFATLQLN